jgi:peroxiredoxin
LKTRKIGKWVDVSTDYIFKDKKVILFSLPGAFIRVCSEKQLTGFEESFKKYLYNLSLKLVLELVLTSLGNEGSFLKIIIEVM